MEQKQPKGLKNTPPSRWRAPLPELREGIPQNPRLRNIFPTIWRKFTPNRKKHFATRDKNFIFSLCSNRRFLATISVKRAMRFFLKISSPLKPALLILFYYMILSDIPDRFYPAYCMNNWDIYSRNLCLLLHDTILKYICKIFLLFL